MYIYTDQLGILVLTADNLDRKMSYDMLFSRTGHNTNTWSNIQSKYNEERDHGSVLYIEVGWQTDT